MNITTLDYFDESIVKELKKKWHSTTTHALDKIIGSDRYIILGVEDNNNYDIATAIYPTFEEKLDKWNVVMLIHRNVPEGDILATYVFKM